MARIFKNRVTEKDIRNWLDRNGFFGRAAEINDLELHAIKRPGWRQIFRFTVKAKPVKAKPNSGSELIDSTSPNRQGSRQSDREVRYGVVLDDQRKRTEAQQTQIFIFESIDERDEVLDDLSVDMLTCSTGQNGDLIVLAVVVVIFVVVALLLGSLVGN